ncbi:M48 family metallopeptidase [Brucella anthropi]|uniref:M48 metallopeptidase family protein n=1 Tax=Brucella anthropi TaxID=529 RepID=UPI00244A4CCC|nr:M48 family metallopeptidase [Brucella anthropi]MDH0369679.1 M48 family metallopeptidase [Brucella anthropi]
MSDIGKPERVTQKRVIELFRDELGYRFLGDWSDRDNSNIDDDLATASLTRRGYEGAQISAAIYKLRTEAGNASRNLYANNQAVYNLLRYGVNLELAKKAPECLDYVVLHEMLHFIVPDHSARFQALLDERMPGWRQVRQGLNEAPLFYGDMAG